MEEKKDFTTEQENEKLAVEQEEQPVKQTKKQLFWEIFRFLLVGGTATIVDYLVFWLFDGLLLPLIPVQGEWWATFSLVLSTAIAFCMAVIVNWILSVKFVFKAVKNKEDSSSKKSFLIFVVIGVIGLGITELGVLLLVWLLPEFSLFGVTEILGTTWAKWLAKVIMTLIVLVWNYIGRKLFVFKS